ncbi:Zinc-type alcohol dehydrogenase-like protein C2E1P3,01 [Talaromyces islandicus]|uniref:Zinc-type alcohol dehydrogenase-like protein C2E1P3,01 n=1 Tax=Talaromyces islandicus TaxID=28573 RepID=A0A0U1MBK9_TALIS|nr:Zinc-type alcohol dehydrogenase-like protein C2E1P3,01 [Talaromyces islandicus]
MAALTNRAVWQDACGVPSVVRDNSLPTNDELGEHEVLIKVHSWAINPCDYMLQDRDMIKYPVILGCDVSGTVEAVVPGSIAASQFQVGDRVFGFTANRGFQDYVVLEDKLMAKIPGDMAYSEAVVLGLCSATSSMLLFGKDYLHLDYPKKDVPKKGKSVLIWGGSSAVGSAAIQLAKGGGYDVIATCSKKNFDYVKGLGAVQVFDYKHPNVTEEIATELDKGACAGIFMAAGLKIGNIAAFNVAAASKQKISFVSSNLIDNIDDVPEGVDVKQPTVEDFKPIPECWFETILATFGEYLPEALANGTYKVAPPPMVVNRRGLEGIQEAIDRMKEDKISPIKLVVERP